jgi:BlaI family transcriptional regulator, penicillinase repressor
MTKHPPVQPSDAELAILKVLWQCKHATAKEIHEDLNRGKESPRVVTTTAKLLQIMMGKKLVVRDESTWPHTYKAAVPREAVLRNVVSQTLAQAFDKSASQFMLAALETGAVDSAEISRIKAMLEAYEKERENE